MDSFLRYLDASFIILVQISKLSMDILGIEAGYFFLLHFVTGFVLLFVHLFQKLFRKGESIGFVATALLVGAFIAFVTSPFEPGWLGLLLIFLCYWMGVFSLAAALGRS